eukprot:UC1_evm1s1327
MAMVSQAVNPDLNSSSFERMLAELDEAFSSDKVCIETVERILTRYKSDVKDWSRFAHFSDD